LEQLTYFSQRSRFDLRARFCCFVYGFATVAGLILMGKDMTPASAIVPTIVSIGAGFGWVPEFIGGKMTKA
jgi:hypothetical protein